MLRLALAFLIAVGGSAAAQSPREAGRRHNQPQEDWSDHDGEYTGGRVGGWYQNGHWDELCECWHEGRWRD